MMIQMLVHQRRPLLWRQSPKEAMRMRRAARRPRRGKPVNLCVQPFPLHFQVAIVAHHKSLYRRRIPPQWFIVPHHLRLHDPTDDPSHQQPRRQPLPKRQLESPRAMRHSLRRIHSAPLPIAVRPQACDPFLNLHYPRRFKQILHLNLIHLSALVAFVQT
jgi:hypothetical protein